MGHISRSKKIILSGLGILLILSLLVGVSYAYYMVSVSQTNKNIVKSSCLNLEELEGSTLASKYIMTWLMIKTMLILLL